MLRPLIVIVALAAACSAAAAQIIVVDTVEDRVDPPFANQGSCSQFGIAALPGADGRVSLREAMLAADFTAGAQTVTFAPNLAGRTIRLTYDDVDSNSDVETLPSLCFGNTTIDGDLDDDGDPDVSIDGILVPNNFIGIAVYSSNNIIRGLRLLDFDFGFYLGHHRGDPDTVQRNNQIRDNEIIGARFGLQVVAGDEGPNDPGRIEGITISGNRITNSSQQAIAIRARTSSSQISGVDVAENVIEDNANFGVIVVADPDTQNTAIADVSVRDNLLRGNLATGVLVAGLDRSRNARLERIRIESNDLDNRSAPAIYLAGGLCGGRDNLLTASVLSNATRIGSQGIRVEGGSNQGCSTGSSEAFNNQVEVAIRDNILSRSLGNSIDLLGGAGGGAVQNRITATVADNQIVASSSTGLRALGGVLSSRANRVNLSASNNVISDSGFLGIALVGGSSAQTAVSQDNLVIANLRNNSTSRSDFVGIALIGGSGNHVRSNRVEATLDNERSCGAENADVRCLGFQNDGVTPVTDASGNTVVAQLAATEATRITIDPSNASGTCSLQQTGTVPCLCRGDCSGDDSVTVDEILSLVNVALGNSSINGCLAGDLDGNRQITVDEIVSALADALLGC